MKKLFQFITIGAFVLLGEACTEVEDQTAALLAPILNDENYLYVTSTDPLASATAVPASQDITITFNKAINTQRCIGAFTITPYTVGNFTVYDAIMKFDPDGSLSTGTYVIEISKDCEDLENRDLHTEYTFTFAVQ